MSTREKIKNNLVEIEKNSVSIELHYSEISQFLDLDEYQKEMIYYCDSVRALVNQMFYVINNEENISELNMTTYSITTNAILKEQNDGIVRLNAILKNIDKVNKRKLFIDNFLKVLNPFYAG